MRKANVKLHRIAGADSCFLSTALSKINNTIAGLEVLAERTFQKANY